MMTFILPLNLHINIQSTVYGKFQNNDTIKHNIHSFTHSIKLFSAITRT